MRHRGIVIWHRVAFGSVGSLWSALPRDGQVRPFLRSDTVRAYLNVVILGAFALGVVNIVTGIVP